MSLLNNGVPVPLHEIRPRSYVQMDESETWRQLEKWTVLDKSTRPGAPRFQVQWVGSEYPSSYVREPSWPVWVGDEPPRRAGVVL